MREILIRLLIKHDVLYIGILHVWISNMDIFLE